MFFAAVIVVIILPTSAFRHEIFIIQIGMTFIRGTRAEQRFGQGGFAQRSARRANSIGYNGHYRLPT